MAIIEHEGSRMERTETVANIPENEWTLDALLDLFLGLHDHGWQVSDSARIKLLKMSCNPDIKSLILHPRDLAFKYIRPSTYEQTFGLVKEMKELGLLAKDICINFFKEMRNESNEKIFKSLEILKGSELEPVIKPIVDKIIIEKRKRRG